MATITVEKTGHSPARKNLHRAWAAKTLFTTSNGRHVELSTYGEKGKITSFAQLGDYKKSEGGFDSFSYVIFGDKNWRLANETVGRVSEILVNAQHAAAVQKFMEMNLEI